MKRLLSVIFTILLLLAALPIVSSAETTVKLVNTSGVVYPGCTLTISVIATGEQIEILSGNPIEYDHDKLELQSSESKISGWEYKVGAANFMFPSNMPELKVSGTDKELLRFTFKLKDSAKIGDELTVRIRNVKMSATSKFEGDLKYNVTVVEKPKSTNCNLMALSVSEGTLSPSFDSKILEYAVTVPNPVTALSITAQQANSAAKVEISGNEDFVVGENTVNIKVTAENGDVKNYVLKVTRSVPPSTDTALSGITVSEGNLYPAFDASQTEYLITVNSNVTKLTLNAVASDSKAKISVSGNGDFVVGENTVTIKVTAEDGVSTAVYTLKVTRMRPTDTDPILSSISFGDFSLDRTFDGEGENRTYSVTVPYEVSNVSLLAVTTRSSYAKYNVDAPEQLNVGENTVTVTCIAEDGENTAVYTLLVTRSARILNSDSTLKSLTCDYGELSPAFSPEVTVYTLVTEPNPPSITFSAIAADPLASAEAAVLAPVPNLNVQTINCTAEDGTVTVYTVYVFVPVKEGERALIIKGTPLVGEKLTVQVIGESDGGKVSWYLNNVKQPTELNTYTLTTEDAGKEIRAVYNDVDGTELRSEPLKIASANAVGGNSFTTAELVITVCVALICLAFGTVFGIFFTKKRYDSYR